MPTSNEVLGLAEAEADAISDDSPVRQVVQAVAFGPDDLW